MNRSHRRHGVSRASPHRNTGRSTNVLRVGLTRCSHALLGLLLVLSLAAHASTMDQAPTPTSTIDLAALGYSGLSTAARQSGGSNLSVDFLDGQHVLVTFNPKQLFKRRPECPPTHADRLIHAVVIELPRGNVVGEKDWYLHDLRRYVWNLGGGMVLLRRMNQLYEVHANLEEKLIYDSPEDLLWVSVTADGQQIIVETKAEAKDDAKNPKAKNAEEKGPKNKDRVKVVFLDARSRAVERMIDVRGTVSLEGTSLGAADVRRQGGNWLVEFGSSNIARVKARRPPNLLYTSTNTLIVGRCSVSREGYGLSSFTVTGTFLWRQHWDQCRYSPVARDSEDGSRSALGTLTIRTNVPEQDSEGLDQHVLVLDTATGKEIMAISVTPAVPGGQNFALSPDGRTLGAVNGRTLQVYELPEMSPEDRARHVAVKSDTPSLSAPPAQPGETEPVLVSSGTIATENQKDAIAATPRTTPVPAEKRSRAEEVPTLTLHTGTQVVALDVVVTDSSGKLVKSLAPSAFRVVEDGKEQTVRYFREFADAKPETPAAPAPASPLPPNVFSNHTQSPDAGAVTVVLMDVLNTPLADQAHTQDELIKFLRNKPRDAKIAICVLGNRLQMIQGFTSDQGVLLAAAKGKKASQRHRPLLDPDSVIPVSLEAGRATAQYLYQLNFFVESVALQQSEARLIDADQRMMVTVDAFAQLARYLSGIPGRKNLVWLSGSFLLGIYPEANGRNPFLESHIYGEELKKVANLLGDAHVAVYPVDVKGLETNPIFTATTNDVLAPVPLSTPPTPLFRNGPRVANVAGAVANSVMMDQFNQFGVQQMDEHATMKQLADQTGGQAYFNSNGIAQAINTAAEQGSNYYALSYTPTNRIYDGKFRKIHVSLAGHKYHLAYRSGYYAVDPLIPAKSTKNLMSSLARAAMQQGSPASRQIVFGARVVPVGKPRVVQATASQKQSKKRKDKEPLEMQRYAVDHAVTFSDLSFTPTGKGTYHGVVNFMVTAFDKEGELTASEVSQTVADLKPEALQDIRDGGMRVHQEVEVPVKSISMRIGVEDVTNSHVGTLEIALPVLPPPDGNDGSRRPMPPVEPD
jgi:VWFA-related protein